MFGVFGVFLKPGYYQYELVLEDIVFSSPPCKNKILLEVGDPSSDTGWTSKSRFLPFSLGQKTVKIQFWCGWYM